MVPGLSTGGGSVSDASPTTSEARLQQRLRTDIGGNMGINFGSDPFSVRTGTLVTGAIAVALGVGLFIAVANRPRRAS